MNGSPAALPCFISSERPILSAGECARIVELGAGLPVRDGDVVSSGPGRPPVEEQSVNRKSSVAFFDKVAETEWIYAKLLHVVRDTNRRFWNFELAGVDRIQFTRYGAAQHYDWHMDLGSQGPHRLRKLSLTLQLSDPADYEGGDLQLNVGRDVVTAPRQQGMITLFPSYVLHRVSPVTAGCRHSLVQWVLGARPFA